MSIQTKPLISFSHKDTFEALSSLGSLVANFSNDDVEKNGGTIISVSHSVRYYKFEEKIDMYEATALITYRATE